jgi:membrane associated rhomboid family serine protease
MNQPPMSEMHLQLTPTRVVKRLLIAHISLWLLFSVLINFMGQTWAYSVYNDLALLPAACIFEFKFWQVFTYAWIHDLGGATHVLFNMLGLFFLGPPLERRWGERAFLQYYLWSLVIAGFASVVFGLLFPGQFGVMVIGASGGVMALLAAFSMVLPDAVILFAFIIPMKARHLVWIAVGLDTAFFFSGTSSFAYHTHMGGVFAGWLLITGNWRPRLARDRFLLLVLRRRKARHSKHPNLRVLPGGKKDDEMLN